MIYICFLDTYSVSLLVSKDKIVTALLLYLDGKDL